MSVVLDSAVSITVGTGPEQVRVPDVTGQREEVARPNIEGAGFVVQITEIDSGLPKEQVVSADPTGGTSATKGSTVTLRVSNGSQVAMPDLTNKTVSEALSTLRAAGWAGTASQLVQNQSTTLTRKWWARSSRRPSLRARRSPRTRSSPSASGALRNPRPLESR